MTITSRFTRLKAGLAATALLAAGATAVATAAEPSSGTVSPQNPRVAWEGTVTSSGVHQMLWEDDPSIPCPAPICDTFALTVDGGKQDLTIGLNIQDLSATGDEPGGGIRVTKPDGSMEYVTGTSGPETTLRYRLKGADPGDYDITVNSSYLCCGSAAYKAFAEVPAPDAGGTPPPGGEPPAAPQLTITGPKSASARSVKKSRKLKIAVESTGPVSNVKALLAKGRTRIATGALASLNGKASITVKASRKAARRIKKGSYSLSVSGTDGEGRTVGSAVTLKLRR